MMHMQRQRGWMAASCGVGDLQKCTFTDPLLYTIDIMCFLVDESLCLRFSPYIHLDAFYHFPAHSILAFFVTRSWQHPTFLAYLFLQGYMFYSWCCIFLCTCAFICDMLLSPKMCPDEPAKFTSMYLSLSISCEKRTRTGFSRSVELNSRKEHFLLKHTKCSC